MVRNPERFTVGILALQGAFREHRFMLEKIGAHTIEVRLPEHLKRIDGLIIPGGESTTIGKLMVEWKLLELIREMGKKGMPIWGTCAGAILLAKRIVERETEMDQSRLGLLDVTAIRNAFGRQRESFEAELEINGLESTYHGVFIRAPLITDIGLDVHVYASVDDEAVFVRQNNLMATSFHPELSTDDRIHRSFLNLIESRS